MEDEIKRADEQIPDLKPDDSAEDDLTPAPTQYRPEQSVSCCGTRAIRGGKLHAYDWLDDLPTPPNASDLVEVQFKNTRKAYFRNSTGIQLKMGDIVAVESSPGHDIGTVTLQGRLVYLQMHKNHVNPQSYEFRRIYRLARPTDIEKWEEAKGLENETMLQARKIAQDLHLNMKIGDVEYQGDRTKAIFYYIADERVDFRELIKVLADKFRVRIEMRQIGARQEAGRIGGIGPCGREMCCASWMTSFISVSTHSARVQDLSLNPVKLAGQCGKLKCCLNYELATYIDAVKHFPPTDKPLETAEGTYYFFKYDIFKRLMWYSQQKDSPSNIVAVDADHVAEIQKMNAEGKKPDTIGSTQQTVANEEENYSSVVELDDDLTRFDSKNRRGGRNDRRGGGRDNNNRRGGGRNDQRGRDRQGGNRQRPDGAQQQAQSQPADQQQQQPADGAQQQPQQQQRRQDGNQNNNRDRQNNRGPRDQQRRGGGNGQGNNRDRQNNNGQNNGNRGPRDNRDRRNNQNRQNRGPRPDNGGRQDNQGQQQQAPAAPKKDGNE